MSAYSTINTVTTKPKVHHHLSDLCPSPIFPLERTVDSCATYQPPLYASQDACGLLTLLPLELRLDIFRYVLCGNPDTYIDIKYFYISIEEDFTKLHGRRRSLYDKLSRRLPLEKVYGRYMARQVSPWQTKQLRSFPGILSTCRQAHDECVSIMYSETTFVCAPPGISRFNSGVRLPESVMMLHKFGDVRAVSLIRSLAFTWALSLQLHRCGECWDLYERVWARLASMPSLRYVRITPWLDYGEFKLGENGMMFGPGTWRDHGSGWVTQKLLALKQVRRAEIYLPRSLHWMQADLLALNGEVSRAGQMRVVGKDRDDLSDIPPMRISAYAFRLAEDTQAQEGQQTA